MTTSTEIEIAERNAEIIRIRKEEGLSQQEIADRFSLSIQRISQILAAYVSRVPIEVEQYRNQELVKLEHRREQVADRIQAALDRGDDKTFLSAIATDVRISESIRRLVGADAPVKTEVGISAHFTYEIKGVENL